MRADDTFNNALHHKRSLDEERAEQSTSFESCLWFRCHSFFLPIYHYEHRSTWLQHELYHEKLPGTYSPQLPTNWNRDEHHTDRQKLAKVILVFVNCCSGNGHTGPNCGGQKDRWRQWQICDWETLSLECPMHLSALSARLEDTVREQIASILLFVLNVFLRHFGDVGWLIETSSNTVLLKWILTFMSWAIAKDC